VVVLPLPAGPRKTSNLYSVPLVNEAQSNTLIVSQQAEDDPRQSQTSTLTSFRLPAKASSNHLRTSDTFLL
jgi:hypothetical protein